MTPITKIPVETEPTPRHNSSRPSVPSLSCARALAYGTSGAQAAMPKPAMKFGAGAIVAALFLEKFTAGAAWAHLDIAGPMRAPSDTHELAKGATGFGTRLLISYLRDLAGGRS